METLNLRPYKTVAKDEFLSMLTPIGIKCLHDLLTKFCLMTIKRDSALYSIGMTVVKRVFMIVTDRHKKFYIAFNLKIVRTMEDCPNHCDVPLCAYDFEFSETFNIYNGFYDYKVGQNIEHLDKGNNLRNFLMN